MRALLEGGGLESKARISLYRIRAGKLGRNQQGCFPQDFALIDIYVISAWHLDQSSGFRPASRDERQSGRLGAEGPGGVAHPVEGGGGSSRVGGHLASSFRVPPPVSGLFCRFVHVLTDWQRSRTRVGELGNLALGPCPYLRRFTTGPVLSCSPGFYPTSLSPSLGLTTPARSGRVHLSGPEVSSLLVYS